MLTPLFPAADRREAGNTILYKRFPGGQVRLAGADSPRGFRRIAVRVVAFDEVDGYPPTAGEEGDQLRLGIYPRNEALDCRVYARAAALVGIDRWDESRWAEFLVALGMVPGNAPPTLSRPKAAKADEPYL